MKPIYFYTDSTAAYPMTVQTVLVCLVRKLPKPIRENLSPTRSIIYLEIWPGICQKGIMSPKKEQYA